MPPTSIDGVDISGATIDGTEVTEITADGNVVFSGSGIDGEKFYMTFAASVNQARQYDLTTEYDVATATNENTYSFSNKPRVFAMSADGTKLVTDGSNVQNRDALVEYDLSTAYDPTTRTEVQQVNINNINGSSNAYGGAWNVDGTKVYVAEISNDRIASFSNTTAFTLDGLSAVNTFSDSNINSAMGISWNDDGTKMYLSDYSAGSIVEYSLSTAFDISTASYVSTQSENNDVASTQWTPNGDFLYVAYYAVADIKEYQASTPFDLSSTDSGTDILTNSKSNVGDIEFSGAAQYK